MGYVRVAASVGVATAVLGVAAPAGAQERLHFEELGDEQLARTTLQREGDAVEPWRAQTFVAGGGAMRLDGASGDGPTVAAGVGLGAWASSTRFLQFYSEAMAPDANALGAGLTLRNVEGSIARASTSRVASD
jgi:hypothetical protein